MPHREEKKRDSDDEEDNNPLPELAESLTATRVSTLLERRRTSTTLASINLQAASSAVGVSELSPATAGTTPTSASNRRASLVPATPTRKDALPSPVRSATVDLAARRSSVALNQIGGEDQRRGSALFAGTTSGKDPPSPFRVTFGAATRLDSPSSTRFPPPLGPPPSSSRDPLLNMNQNDLRRPSFAQTIAATGESILKGQSPRRKLRKAATRLLLLGLLLFALAKALAFLFPSYDILPSSPARPSPQVDPYTQDQLPAAFTEFANRPPPIAEPSPSLKPAKGVGRGSQEPVLSGEELRRFREDHLWGPPSDKVETEVVKPEEGQSHEATVVFIHGLLQTSADSPLAQHLPKRFPNVRWVMPQAPKKHVTVQDGAEVYAWFDMLGFPYDNAVDEDPVNLYSSARLINTVLTMERDELVRNLRRRGGIASLPEEERIRFESGKAGDQEEEGEFGTVAEKMWASGRIVLSGFSQGSVMTLLTGLTTRHRLAGLVVMSGFMPLRGTLKSLTADLDRTDLPIFWGHGEADEYLTVEDATHSVWLLRSQSANSNTKQGGLGLTDLQFETYPGVGHTYWGGELDDISLWMERVLPMARMSLKGRRAVAHEAEGLRRVRRR